MVPEEECLYNPSTNCQNISIKIRIVDLTVVPAEESGDKQKTVGFLSYGSRRSVVNLIVIHPVIVETFMSGPK